MQLKQLGPYEIGRPLGKGGMGSVYEASDTQTGQRVAVKALAPHLAVAEGFRERFEAEIESLKTLRHEGIVRLYGYGEQDGVLFYSMELVEGISLEDELKAGRRFYWREVTSIAIQLSLALKHAHDHGIVHRDIKPANILLYDEDRVKLADFGIARLFGTTQLTTAGGVLGTADYMSPEQAEGRPVSARCDQYSLGGVMYALLAGRPPFLAQNLPQMLQLQRFAKPDPVRRYAPDTPVQLERVIEQLLAKDPADRFPNTQVLARHLQALARALSRPAADDFALAGDEPPSKSPPPAIEQSADSERTQTESEVASRAPGARSSAFEDPGLLDDAATVAAESLAPPRPPTAGHARDVTVPPSAGLTQAAAERPTRFTTLEEEEEARLRAQNRRSWLAIFAQLGVLVGVLAGFVALAFYLSRPPSADALYAAISAQVEVGDEASLSEVASEVNEFLQRYPNDPRADELRQYQQKLELDRLQRQLYRQLRLNGASDVSRRPVERLYLSAVGMAQHAPDEAMATLRSLVDLYGPTTDDDSDAAAIVQLAQRQLEALSAQTTERREQQLASLRERLEAAGRIAQDDPQQATAMYRAIVDLHAGDEWAEGVVGDARRRLAELEER